MFTVLETVLKDLKLMLTTNGNSRKELSMIDIRAVCKVFLDFVYDNKILPNDIVDILENYQSKWDFRLLCDILNYKDKCYQKNENDEYTVKSEISRYRNSLKNINIWVTLEHQRKLKYLHDACNDFFHNVTTNDEEFISMIKSLLSSVSEKYNKDDYIDKINLFNTNNTTITNELKKVKAELETTQKELKNAKIEIGRLKNKEKTTCKENEWTRASAEMYCNANGYEVSQYFNYASPNKLAKGEYWINAALDSISNDWDIILNDKNNHCFHILHIPANTFFVDDFNIKTGKRSGSKLDFYIDMKSFKDRNNINFKPYLVKTIKY